MELPYFGHEHPLLFNEEQSNCSEAEAANCSRCGEAISGPSFSCEECKFYLHKQCAKAPSQINHPFHHSHPLILLPNPPYKSKDNIFNFGGEKINHPIHRRHPLIPLSNLHFMTTGCSCSFCGETADKFVYHCSCNIDLHIKCALFTYDMAEESFREELLQGIAYKDPSICIGIGMEELLTAKCFGCWEPLLDSVYCSLDRGFKLHKDCAELPHEISHPCHREHPLILQFSGEIFSCAICHDRRLGFIYHCSPCNFIIHIACLSSPTIIEDEGHPHPFTLFLREFPFTCDACGSERKCFPYMCFECCLLVHKECNSLPRVIKFTWHEHPIFHYYFLPRLESDSWDCVICCDKVDTKYGSYSCFDCHFIVHVNCVMKFKNWYHVIEAETIDEKLEDSDSDMTVIERNEDGEAMEIKHFSHVHNLMLSDNFVKDEKYCEGCTLPISYPFYYCSECNFYLHKRCAEFPKLLDIWFHICQPFILVPENTFKCFQCEYVCNGFAYQCDKYCRSHLCLRCAIPYTVRCQGHEHPLSFYMEYNGNCNACGDKIMEGFKCKGCNFALEVGCLLLPDKAPHKCDEHLLTLTYTDHHNTYSERNFCDICEKDRNPSHWFYYCGICDNSAHPGCVLGRYPFMKLGRMYEASDHPHPLTLVKKIHHYPECFICGDPCRDLALECVMFDSECGYIVHWDCLAPSHLRE